MQWNNLHKGVNFPAVYINILESLGMRIHHKQFLILYKNWFQIYTNDVPLQVKI